MACNRWRDKAATDKAWDALKKHFKAADSNHPLNSTTKEKGFSVSTNSSQAEQFDAILDQKYRN